MRIVSLPAGATELLAELGLRAEIGGTALGASGLEGVPVVARPVGGEREAYGQLPLVETPAHQHVSRYIVDRDAVAALRPQVVITEEVCPVCLAAYAPLAAGAAVAKTTLGGREARLVSLHPRRLEDVLASVVPLATLLEHADRGHSLLKVRSSRLLALSMHVARYLVRHGGERPRVLLATLPDGGAGEGDSQWRLPGRWVPDLIDAAGGLPLLATAGEDDVTQAAEALRQAQPEVLIVGGTSLAEALSASARLCADPRWQEVPAVRDGRVWALRFDGLFTHPSPRLVDGVEVLLRIIAPQVLGANGTPPAPEQAVPVPSPAARSSSL